MNELFWLSNEIERENGYIKNNDCYHCLLCDYKTEIGFIYPKGDLFVDANKEMIMHIETEHGSVFEYLINEDKKVTGLSDHQRKIIKLFYDGLSDYDIQQTLDIGSVSTVRNHRALLKEKEKQAKATITLMGILNKNTNPKKEVLKPHKTATMIDRRYDITIEDTRNILNKYFPNGTENELTTFLVKEKSKIIILREIIKKFNDKKEYGEKEVNDILKDIYPSDHVVLRRYLIQYGFMNRTKDGSKYWVKKEEVNQKTSKSKNSDRKKELIKEFKTKKANEKVENGVYQIKNTLNGKVYIGKSRNINSLNGVIFQLNTGSFTNKELQNDWKELGAEKFSIEILESFEEEKVDNVNKELKELYSKWKEKLKPYEKNGYHRK